MPDTIFLVNGPPSKKRRASILGLVGYLSNSTEATKSRERNNDMDTGREIRTLLTARVLDTKWRVATGY